MLPKNDRCVVAKKLKYHTFFFLYCRRLTKISPLFQALLLLQLMIAGCKSGHQPLRQDIYVWQRGWQQNTASAIADIAPQIGRFAVLAAEITFPSGEPKTVWSQPDYQALRKTGRPLVLCVRIGAWTGPFAKEHKTSVYILNTVEKVLAQARHAGVTPVELQIDFDCAEAHLAGYRKWLQQLRRVSGDLLLSFTALPAWLRHPNFVGLLKEADSFVLQVHSLQKSGAQESVYTLCDGDAAIDWVNEANGYRKDFSVALPTYGYEIATDNSGRLLDVLAEEPTWNPPKGARRSLVMPDAGEMAGLVRFWQQQQPRHLTSISWFRLPLSTDQLNWPMVALQAVMSGRTPRTELQTSLQNPEPGLAEIWLVNSGETLVYQARIEASFVMAKLLAAEATTGFSLRQTADTIIFATTPTRESGLRPGDKINLGWLRFADAQDVSLTVLQGN